MAPTWLGGGGGRKGGAGGGCGGGDGFCSGGFCSGNPLRSLKRYQREEVGSTYCRAQKGSLHPMG